MPPVDKSTAGDDPVLPDEGLTRSTNPDGTDRKEFYCPGCGRQYSYMRECTGHAASPHQPIELVPSAELDGEPDRQDRDAYASWAEGVTAAPPTDR
jgi:hypothetical protein